MNICSWKQIEWTDKWKYELFLLCENTRFKRLYKKFEVSKNWYDFQF